MIVCRLEMIAKGVPVPRTCPKCGIGVCQKATAALDPAPRTPHGERVDRLARTMCKRAGHPPETLVSQPGSVSFNYDTPAGPAASRAPAAVPLWHGWRPVAVQALAALEEMAALDARENAAIEPAYRDRLDAHLDAAEKARRATVAAGLASIGQQRANVAADVLRSPAWTTAEEQRQRANVAAQSYVQEIADGIEQRSANAHRIEADEKRQAERRQRRDEAERAASLRAAGSHWRGRWAAETEQAP